MPPPPPAVGMTPLAAYSTRRVVASYTGPVVNVRNGASGATMDFYPFVNFGTTPPTYGLASAINGQGDYGTWIGAATGFVVTWCDWLCGLFALRLSLCSSDRTTREPRPCATSPCRRYDQSGNGKNATQATAAAQPLLVPHGALQGFSLGFLAQARSLSFAATTASILSVVYSSISCGAESSDWVTVLSPGPAMDKSLRLTRLYGANPAFSNLNVGDFLLGSTSFYTNGAASTFNIGSCLASGAWNHLAGEGQSLPWAGIGLGASTYGAARAFDGRAGRPLPAHVHSSRASRPVSVNADGGPCHPLVAGVSLRTGTSPKSSSTPARPSPPRTRRSCGPRARRGAQPPLSAPPTTLA